MGYSLPVVVEGWYVPDQIPRNARPLSMPGPPRIMVAARFADDTWVPVSEVRLAKAEDKPFSPPMRGFREIVDPGFDLDLVGQYYPVPYRGQFQVHKVELLPFQFAKRLAAMVI